jgi:hypothetical protein
MAYTKEQRLLNSHNFNSVKKLANAKGFDMTNSIKAGVYKLIKSEKTLIFYDLFDVVNFLDKPENKEEIPTTVKDFYDIFKFCYKL